MNNMCIYEYIIYYIYIHMCLYIVFKYIHIHICQHVYVFSINVCICVYIYIYIYIIKYIRMYIYIYIIYILILIDHDRSIYTQLGKSVHRLSEHKSPWDAVHSGSQRSQQKFMQISMGCYVPIMIYFILCLVLLMARNFGIIK